MLDQLLVTFRRQFLQKMVAAVLCHV